LFSCQNPSLHLFFLQSYRGVSSLSRQIHEVESIAHDLFLHGVVEGRVTAKGRTLIHLDQPWSEFVVDHDVEAQYLEAHSSVQILWLAGAVQVTQVGLADDERLHNLVFDLCPELSGVSSFLIDDGEDGS